MLLPNKDRSPGIDQRCAADVVMLGVLASDEYDAHKLALFLRDHRRNHSKPLIAVGTGTHGQLSRIVATISFVTHEFLPSAAAAGQMALARIHQAMHLHD